MNRHRLLLGFLLPPLPCQLEIELETEAPRLRGRGEKAPREEQSMQGWGGDREFVFGEHHGQAKGNPRPKAHMS